MQSTYDPDFHPEMGRNLALMGATDAEIARAFGISTDALKNWLKRHNLLRKRVEEGRVFADAEVAGAVFKRATGRWKQRATKIMQYEGDVITQDYIERFAPDIGAAKFWMTNRQPAKWKERVSNEHGGPDGGPIKITKIEHVIVDPQKAR